MTDDPTTSGLLPPELPADPAVILRSGHFVAVLVIGVLVSLVSFGPLIIEGAVVVYLASLGLEGRLGARAAAAPAGPL
ncbi:MAG: hypothetical protein ACXWXV_11350 [Aeromicrobium sp.]